MSTAQLKDLATSLGLTEQDPMTLTLEALDQFQDTVFTAATLGGTAGGIEAFNQNDGNCYSVIYGACQGSKSEKACVDAYYACIDAMQAALEPESARGFVTDKVTGGPADSGSDSDGDSDSGDE
jgi:hypothetical protein